MKLKVRKVVNIMDSEGICLVIIDDTGSGKIVFRGKEINVYGFSDLEMLIEVIKRAIEEVRSKE